MDGCASVFLLGIIKSCMLTWKKGNSWYKSSAQTNTAQPQFKCFLSRNWLTEPWITNILCSGQRKNCSFSISTHLCTLFRACIHILMEGCIEVLSLQKPQRWIHWGGGMDALLYLFTSHISIHVISPCAAHSTLGYYCLWWKISTCSRGLVPDRGLFSCHYHFYYYLCVSIILLYPLCII